MASIKKLTSLKSKLVELIRLRGPLSVAEYMRTVLTNPESGFYMNKDVFGVKGHFTTNPEISQVFGEILGVWILQEWKRFNCPQPLQLIEFGPGRGTLMSDIARTLGKFKECSNFNVNMVELSPKLQEIQRETLSNLVDRVKWFSQIEQLETDSNGFTAFIAHEFLDALPIYKFVRDASSLQSDQSSRGMRELLIDYDPQENLRFCISRQPSIATRLLVPPGFQGEHLEVCPDAALLVQKVAAKINQTSKGCMLICDYGFEESAATATIESPASDRAQRNVPSLEPLRSNRDTFRAFKNHEIWPPLKDPGEADLTADVDFGYLKKQLEDRALIFGSVTQKEFLLECGLEARLDVLLDKADQKEKDGLISGAKMMLDDMGDRYKFLTFFPKDSSSLFVNDPPAGFNSTNGSRHLVGQ